MSTQASENPICASRPEPPPSSEARVDPSEPHPDEPGAPADSPSRREPGEDRDDGKAD